MFRVVFLHVSGIKWYALSPDTTSWQVLNLYETLVRGCVPIFFMISGRFLLSKKLDIARFFKKNLLKIIVVYVV
ncbi:MAG: acyltransferase family protein [Coprobacillus sp.]